MSIFNRLKSVAGARGVRWRWVHGVAFVAGCSLAPAVVSAKDAVIRRGADGVWLEGVPRGAERSLDLFGHSLTLVLRQAGVDADYDTVMGDSGMAFVMQASDRGPLIGEDGRKAGEAPRDLDRVSGRRDVGWWPNATECAPAFLEFTGRAAGCRLVVAGGAGYPGADGLAERFEGMRTAIMEAIGSGRACAVNDVNWSVATGYEDGGRRLWSFCPNGGPEAPAVRLGGLPWLAVIPGGRVERMERRAADRESLRHAVSLIRDGVPMPGGYVTGGKAFELWSRELRQTSPRGRPEWHANVVRSLAARRRAATKYLAAMAARHGGSVHEHLERAADLYREVVGLLEGVDTGAASIQSDEGRRVLLGLASRIPMIEKAAAERMDLADVGMEE